jgi:hypothetical protein
MLVASPPYCHSRPNRDDGTRDSRISYGLSCLGESTSAAIEDARSAESTSCCCWTASCSSDLGASCAGAAAEASRSFCHRSDASSISGSGCEGNFPRAPYGLLSPRRPLPDILDTPIDDRASAVLSRFVSRGVSAALILLLGSGKTSWLTSRFNWLAGGASASAACAGTCSYGNDDALLCMSLGLWLNVSWPKFEPLTGCVSAVAEGNPSLADAASDLIPSRSNPGDVCRLSMVDVCTGVGPTSNGDDVGGVCEV